MDVLEPIFIIRDALRGDWLGAGLGMADLGLGPLVDGMMALRRFPTVAGLSDEVAGSLAPLRRVDEGVLDRAGTHGRWGARSTYDFAEDYYKGLGTLSGQSKLVTQENIEKIISHLRDSKYLDNALEVPANSLMIERLVLMLEQGVEITGADLSFYLHELTEADMIQNILHRNPTLRELTEEYTLSVLIYDPMVEITDDILNTNLKQLPWEIHRDIVYHYAHYSALDAYEVSRFSLYHPEVILKDPRFFDKRFAAFWALEWGN